MEYLALYRKYRPSSFDDVIGQEHIIRTLINQIKTNRLGHAYLFTGTRGTGKTSVAKIFAKAINCLNPKNGSPCGECECCKALAEPSNIDVIEIDAASNNGVNEIREIRENVQYPAVSCKYKVYIIDEVHMLSGAAFNALLKTLEEPPKHAVFILATTEVQKIPATILSRCMRFDFKLVSTEMLANHVAKVFDAENKEYEKEAVFAIAKAGEGSVRDSLSIADIALSCGSGKLTYNHVMEVLGTTNEESVLAFVKAVLNGNNSDILNFIDEMCSLGKSVGTLCKDVISVLRNLIVINNCENSNDILALPDSKFELYSDVAKNSTNNRLLRILEIYTEMSNLLKYSNNPRILFEATSLKASSPESDYDIKALLSRITALEDKLNNVKVSSSETPETTPALVKTNQKADLSLLSVQEIKGRLLAGLRDIGSEMLWNVLQTAELEINGRIITLCLTEQNDFDLIQRSENKEKIISALQEFNPFELQITLSKEKIELQEVDEATERIKKIFGDDIVVIKN